MADSLQRLTSGSKTAASSIALAPPRGFQPSTRDDGGVLGQPPFRLAPGSGVVGVPLRQPRRFAQSRPELVADEHRFVRARIHGEPVHLVVGREHRRLQLLVRRGAIASAVFAVAYFGAELIRGAF